MVSCCGEPDGDPLSAHARPWRGRRVPSAGSPRRPRAEWQRWPVSTARLSLSRRRSRYFLLRRVFRRRRRGPCSSPAGACPLSVFRSVRSHIRATFQKEPLPSLCDLPPWRPVARGPRSPSSREPLHLSAASRVARGPCRPCRAHALLLVKSALPQAPRRGAEAALRLDRASLPTTLNASLGQGRILGRTQAVRVSVPEAASVP